MSGPGSRPTSSTPTARRSVQTSTTNIGAYMWSAVAAERLGFIHNAELASGCRRRSRRSSAWSAPRDIGQYYNWYDHRTGAKLTSWPPSPDAPVRPILSSVDNGWLAVGLRIVENSVPQLSRRAGALYDAMDFGFYYRPEVNRVLFHFRPDNPRTRRAATTPSSARAASSTTSGSPAASSRRSPTTAAGARSRTPATTRARRRGRLARWQKYFGVDVFEGALPYNGMRSSRPGAAPCSRR